MFHTGDLSNMTVCPLGKKNCPHRTNKVQFNPSNVCWWWYIEWCNNDHVYDGHKPEPSLVSPEVLAERSKRVESTT